MDRRTTERAAAYRRQGHLSAGLVVVGGSLPRPLTSRALAASDSSLPILDRVKPVLVAQKMAPGQVAIRKAQWFEPRPACNFDMPETDVPDHLQCRQQVCVA